MAKSKALKRGLGAIFNDEDIDKVLDEISSGSSNKTEIAIENIRTNPYQPRTNFDVEALKELSESIKIHGVFQPILVRKAISGYELIAGERRLRASKMAGLTKIPAVIVDFNDQEMMEISLLENIQREDLSVIEEAKAYQQLINKLNYTQEELAARVGKSRSHITNILRLLKLPNKVIEMLNYNELSYTSARALMTLEDEDKIVELAKRIKKDDLSVRDIEMLVKEPNKKVVKEKKVDVYLENVRNTLEKKFDTKVEVNNKNIIIKYQTVDDLNRILEKIDCLEEN